MKTYLKIKISSLAAEARIIRREEQRWPGDHQIRTGLHEHRVIDVRREARSALLPTVSCGIAPTGPSNPSATELLIETRVQRWLGRPLPG